MMTYVSAEDGMVLSTGISVNEIPKAFYGSWRITAKLEQASNYSIFKPQSVDMWTLSRVNDTVTLTNPFTGANAEIALKTVSGNLVVFSKKAPYDNKMLTDTVSIRLDKNSFTGINTLTLEAFSLVDGHLLNTETARYLIKGEKISGDNILAD